MINRLSYDIFVIMCVYYNFVVGDVYEFITMSVQQFDYCNAQ